MTTKPGDINKTGKLSTGETIETICDHGACYIRIEYNGKVISKSIGNCNTRMKIIIIKNPTNHHGFVEGNSFDTVSDAMKFIQEQLPNTDFILKGQSVNLAALNPMLCDPCNALLLCHGDDNWLFIAV